MKSNYYVGQIDKAIKDHDIKYPLSIKIVGSKNESHFFTLPVELCRIIKEWYFLNGDKIGEV